MTRTDFPPSVHPDVCIVNDVTYVALTMDDGLRVYANTFALYSLDRIFPAGDWPRFFAHPDGVLVAYKTRDDNALTVANVTTGVVTRTGVSAFWNSPICWRDDGLLCVQATADCQVWGGVWPALPAGPAIRQGVGTGLAQWLDGKLWTWDEMNNEYDAIYGSQNVWLSGDGVETTGEYQDGGILVDLPGVPNGRGVLAPFTMTNDPRPALAPDGSLSIVHWVQGSQGSVGTVLYEGVTAADLVVNPERPVPPIVPLTGPRIFGTFYDPHYEGAAPTWQNASIVPTSGASVLLGQDGQRWTVCDLEQTPGQILPSPACYIGTPASFVTLNLNNDYDLRFVELYRDPAMSDQDFLAYAQHVISAMEEVDPRTAIGIITNNTTRLGPAGPTLSERNVLAAQALLSRFGTHVLVFATGRQGEVVATHDQYTQWRNGQPCPPQTGGPMASVTITDYQPKSGPAPLSVKATFSHEGDVAYYRPVWRPQGATSWTVATVNPVSDDDHTFVFGTPGVYEIGLEGLDATLTQVAATGLQRLVTVTPSSDPVKAAMADLDAAVATLHQVLGV